jgi:diguanylate cyclase
LIFRRRVETVYMPGPLTGGGTPMRYAESKERSTELLKLALPLMTRQAAALHPVSYTLWYEHVAGINPSLSTVLTSRLQFGQALTEDEVYEIYDRFIVSRDMQVLDHLQRRLRTLIEDVAQTTATTGDDTGRFAKSLEDTQTRLRAASTLDQVSSFAQELLSETRRVQTAARFAAERLEEKAKEVGELTQQLHQAQTEALLDPLTGLDNRRGFTRYVEDLLHDERTLSGAALLLADIDSFKELNDTYGHVLGDTVIRVIGRTLQTNIKGRDRAARFGGDEFAILLPQTTTTGGPAALAEQIRAAVAAGHIRSGEGKPIRGRVTLSIGVAVADSHDTLETLMTRADAALYQAKREGRNRVCVAPSTNSGS